MPTLTANHEVTDHRIADLLCCAFEGGSAYWCRIETVPHGKGHVAAITRGPVPANPWGDDFTPPYIAAPLEVGGSVALVDNDGGRHSLTRDKVMAGLKLMAEKQPRHFSDFLEEYDDADTGDVFLQLCLFGEVRYG